MPANLADIGIQSCATTTCTTIDYGSTMSEAVIKTSTGYFAQAMAFDQVVNWSIKGSGFPHIAIAEASNGDISEIDKGVHICNSVKYTQTNDNYDSYECAGMSYPNAT